MSKQMLGQDFCMTALGRGCVKTLGWPRFKN